MKALLTGMNGTVAPVLATLLESKDVACVAWDRTQVPTDDTERSAAFIKEQKPDWFFQVATGSPDWVEDTARTCYEEGIRFLFTGSVSVFNHLKQGPISVEEPPDATDDYGRYKAECEERIMAVNPEAIIARLGWQIGDAAGSNNMVDYLTNQFREQGEIKASVHWFPSCAFLEDTADALYRLMKEGRPGLYQLEGNPGLSFYDIVSGLHTLHGSEWKIVQTEEPTQNNIMADERISLRPITHTLRIEDRK